MSRIKSLRAIKLGGLLLLTCLVLIYAGGLLLGFAATITGFLVRLLEFIGVVGIPAAGGLVLAWFAYKLLLQPVFRLRKLNRLREYRALRRRE